MKRWREGRAGSVSMNASLGGVRGGEGGNRFECEVVGSHWMTSDALRARYLIICELTGA